MRASIYSVTAGIGYNYRSGLREERCKGGRWVCSISKNRASYPRQAVLAAIFVLPGNGLVFAGATCHWASAPRVPAESPPFSSRDTALWEDTGSAGYSLAEHSVGCLPLPIRTLAALCKLPGMGSHLPLSQLPMRQAEVGSTPPFLLALLPSTSSPPTH